MKIMNIKIKLISIVFLFLALSVSAQKSKIYTNFLNDYNQAVELYQNKSYLAAQIQFNQIKTNFDNSSEIRANCEYYIANCAIRLGHKNSDELMQQFVEKYPTSTKVTNAYIDVANYYFSIGKYSYSAKWYSRVNTSILTIKQKEEFDFNFGYSLFVTKNYAKAKDYFAALLDSQKYGAQAKYYYGFIAYNQDDYETADKYLSEVEDDSSYKTKVSYYLADMNFKLGKFEKAIEYGNSLLETARREEHSEISKIIGESYFNLNKYDEAIPHLKNYKGKRGKWNNTDYYLLGYAFFKQNDFENAIKNFNKIVDGKNGVSQNAYYHLGECYLKQDKKSEALNAFRNASLMKYEPNIQKDAWYNYSKLSYEIGNPYNNVPEVLEEYIKLYPNSKHKSEINDLIISAYISSKDYKSALNKLKNRKTSKQKELYQKVSFFRAIQLFNEENYDEAKENFKNSISIPMDKIIASKSNFWLGETNYRLENFDEAILNFSKFSIDSESSETDEYKNFRYNFGYAYFKNEKYDNAIQEFEKYLIQKPNDGIRTQDSYLRIGDSYFVSRNYSKAIESYNNVLKTNSSDSDYAQFQKAISFGLTGDEKAKIDELNSFLKAHSKSTYKDDVYYILGNSYLKTSQNQLALKSFENLISNYNRSSLVPKALLKKGLIYYNTNDNEKALTSYKSVVKRFPNTPEANQAVKDVRQIYVDLGRVDEYAVWVKDIDFVNVSNAELDNDMFESAEIQYSQNNFKKAITTLEKYLQNFPSGLNSLQANFYLAQSLFEENRREEAIPYYSAIIDSEISEFSEESLRKLSIVYLENDNWDKAIPILEKLENEGELNQNIIFAQSNLMKGFYEQKKYNKAVEYADLVLEKPKIEDRIISDARIIVARSAIETNNETKARAAYREVEKVAIGKLKAEALYYNAYFENQDGSFRVSNKIIQEIVSEFASYKYWAAKSLLVMASNFHELNDAFQATYILENVISNEKFAEFEDVIEEAKQKLSEIKTEQAKTNESVKQ